MDKKKWVLGMTSDDDAFNALKMDFNKILRGTLFNMIQKERDEATMSISLKISLTKGTAPDIDNHSYDTDRDIIIPKFEHKVTGKMQYSDDVSGITGGSDYELIWDKDIGSYIMRPIKDAQQSLWDKTDDDADLDDDADADTETEAAGPKLLPAPDETDAIDVDYTVCETEMDNGDEGEVTDLLHQAHFSDEQIAEAIEVVREAGSASVSLLQRKLSIGYGKASRLMDTLEKMGVVGPFNGSTARTVFYPESAEIVAEGGYDYEEPGDDGEEE